MKPTNYINYTIVSVRRREDKQREPFLILGKFETYDDYVAALKDAMSMPEDYDMRTVKVHDSGGLSTSKGAAAIGLEYTFEDLIYKEKSV